eukprot:IDg5661t1
MQCTHSQSSVGGTETRQPRVTRRAAISAGVSAKRSKSLSQSPSMGTPTNGKRTTSRCVNWYHWAANWQQCAQKRVQKVQGSVEARAPMLKQRQKQAYRPIETKEKFPESNNLVVEEAPSEEPCVADRLIAR